MPKGLCDSDFEIHGATNMLDKRRLRGVPHPNVLADGRAAIMRILHRDGLPGVLAPQATPLSSSIIAGLLNVPSTVVKRTVAPAPAPPIE